MIRNWRATALTLGAAVTGAVAFAAPAAAADVTVTPSGAPRGGPAELAFNIPEEHVGAYTTKVELVAPEATPIAEIYPMSVDGWAPTITTRKLDHPVGLIHGTSTTEVPASITWIRFGDVAPNPGQPAVLTVSLGPMPDTDRVAFTIVQTYSDGTVVRWGDSPASNSAAGSTQPQHPAPVVTLVDQAAAGDPHGGEPAEAAPAAQQDKTNGNGTYGILGAGLLVGLAAGLGLDGWIILRAVRRSSLAAAGSSLAGPK
jgi:uncharacterized protein YcnI